MGIKGKPETGKEEPGVGQAHKRNRNSNKTRRRLWNQFTLLKLLHHQCLCHSPHCPTSWAPTALHVGATAGAVVVTGGGSVYNGTHIAGSHVPELVQQQSSLNRQGVACISFTRAEVKPSSQRTHQTELTLSPPHTCSTFNSAHIKAAHLGCMCLCLLTTANHYFPPIFYQWTHSIYSFFFLNRNFVFVQ